MQKSMPSCSCGSGLSRKTLPRFAAQQVRRDRHHALQTADLGRRSHVDVKIGRFTHWIFTDDQAEARHAPIFFSFSRAFERHKGHRVVLVGFADSFQFMDHRNVVFL